MDYLQGCLDLDKFLEKNKGSLSIINKLLIFSNISNALRFLKRHRVVHMDLNPNNVLMSPGFFTKIIDFGEAYCERTCGPGYTPGFTNPYGPPEVFTQKHFDLKQDVFSFGIIMFKVLFGRLPYQPTESLVGSYKNKSYYQKFHFCP